MDNKWIPIAMTFSTNSSQIMSTFTINDNNNTIQPQLNFESSLKNKPINIGITFDNKYVLFKTTGNF